MSFLGFLGGALKPLIGMVDDFHLSGEEKGQMKIALETLHNKMASEGLKYEAAIAEYKSSIIIAEAKSESWITRSWRPITMLTFVVLIVLISTGLMDTDALAAVPAQLWTLLTIGIGGYMGGRSAEKIVPGIVTALKKKEEL